MFNAGKPKTAIITFEDSRDIVYNRRHALVEEELRKLKSCLEGEAEITLSATIRNTGDIAGVLRQPGLFEAESAILHVPTWVLPNVVTMTANQIRKPLLLFTNFRSDSAGLVGMLASGGGLDEVGIHHRRLFGDGLDAEVKTKLIRFLKAASASSRLRGSTYGLIGGRSLGMYTATADPAQWQREFGVDIEHIDQLEIYKRAVGMDAGRVQKNLDWLLHRVGHVEYEEPRFTPAHLEKQVRSYLALKDIINEKRIDFAGLKCQTELSDGYVIQCISAALINDPYDAEGPKPCTPVACEADCDGALTMAIIHLLTGGAPTALMDVKLFDRAAKLFAFSNCGGMSTWFASRSSNPDENLSKVHLRCHIFGEAGGAATQYVAKEGPVTLARLCRKAGKYWMAIIPGEVVEKEREELRKVVWPWPHMFVSTKIDMSEFLGTFGSNHMHVAAGDISDELREACELMAIESVRF